MTVVAHHRPARALIGALVAAAAMLTGCLVSPGETRAARGMELAIQDDALFVQGNKRWPGDKAFDYARALGITRIRANLLWSYTMLPSQYDSRRKPKVINYNFQQIDEMIDRAAANGIRAGSRKQSFTTARCGGSKRRGNWRN